MRSPTKLMPVDLHALREWASIVDMSSREARLLLDYLPAEEELKELDSTPLEDVLREQCLLVEQKEKFRGYIIIRITEGT